MPSDAQLTGGFSPGAAGVFAVDGDFSICDPCSLPEISYPLQGDSVFSDRDIIQLHATGSPAVYLPVALGTYPNIQPWSANQVATVLTQDFMVAQGYYYPMRLNTPYNPAWADGWQGIFSDGYASVNLNNLFLVREGDLIDCGGGISRLRRTWASIPATRNEIENFTYNFPGYNDTSTGDYRVSYPQTVLSRLQYDYFIFDDWNIITGLPLFVNGAGGVRLNASTGLYAQGLIIPATKYYSAQADAALNNLFLDPTAGLDDGNGQPDTATIPTYSDYQSFVGGAVTSNLLPAELVAESSTMTRWMGNIFERRTRFVIAQ